MDNECAGSMGISDTDLRSGSGVLSRTKFSHLSNSSSGESQKAQRAKQSLVRDAL